MLLFSFVEKCYFNVIKNYINIEIYIYKVNIQIILFNYLKINIININTIQKQCHFINYFFTTYSIFQMMFLTESRIGEERCV